MSQYTREVTNRDVTDNVVTLKTSGTCASDSDAWAFLGPIVALHVCLQLGTNWLLFKVRGVADRYQEQKYVGLASLFVLEILAVGVPVLIAVQDSPAARYIVMAAIVVFNGKWTLFGLISAALLTFKLHTTLSQSSKSTCIRITRHWDSMFCLLAQDALPKGRTA